MERFGRKVTMVPGFTGVTVTMLFLAVTAFLNLSGVWYVAAFLATATRPASRGPKHPRVPGRSRCRG